MKDIKRNHLMNAVVAGLLLGGAQAAQAVGQTSQASAIVPSLTQMEQSQGQARPINVSRMGEKVKDLHSCKTLNSCKGKGGCKTGDKGCAAKNSCKGKGGCATAKHDCKAKNACKGQGGCKTGDKGCAGKNTCKGKGGCASPVAAMK